MKFFRKSLKKWADCDQTADAAESAVRDEPEVERNWQVGSTRIITGMSWAALAIYGFTLVTSIWKMAHLPFSRNTLLACIALLFLGFCIVLWSICWFRRLRPRLGSKRVSLLWYDRILFLALVITYAANNIGAPVFSAIGSSCSELLLFAILTISHFASHYCNYYEHAHGRSFIEWCNAPKNS